MHVSESAPCRLCLGEFGDRCQCPLVPTRGEGDCWLDMLSPTCTAFSMKGNKLGWLDVVNLPLLFYFASLEKDGRCPNFIILECVRRLDLRFLERLTKNKVRFIDTVQSPKCCGMPTGGDRLYGVAACCGFHFAEVPLSLPVLQKYVCMEVVGDANMYLLAPEEEIRKYEDWVNTRPGNANLLPHPRGKRFPARALLGTRAAIRLENHESAWLAARIKNDDLGNVRAIFDISQNVGHSAKPSNDFPRMLRSSFLWSEKRNSGRAGFVLPRELWAAQGPQF